MNAVPGSSPDGQLVGAGKGLGLSEDLLRRLGRGAVGGAEVFGEWRHLTTGSLYASLVARDDMVDEGLHRFPAPAGGRPVVHANGPYSSYGRHGRSSRRQGYRKRLPQISPTATKSPNRAPVSDGQPATRRIGGAHGGYTAEMSELRLATQCFSGSEMSVGNPRTRTRRCQNF